MHVSLLLDQLALMALQAKLARKVSKVRRAIRENLVRKASAVMLGQRVLLASQVKSALAAKTVLTVAMDATV